MCDIIVLITRCLASDQSLLLNCIVIQPDSDIMGSLHDDSDNIKLHYEKQIALNPRERARILRKIDWNLLPFVTVFFLLSFL
jgi:hypothetical protein